jgi:hypothetical protein
MTHMDKQQDAELEKLRERPDVPVLVEEDRTPLFEDADDDLFDEHVSAEDDFEYEPEGAFLD